MTKTKTMTINNWLEFYNEHDEKLFNKIFKEAKKCVANPLKYEPQYINYSMNLLNNDDQAWYNLNSFISKTFLSSVPKKLKSNPKFLEDFNHFIITTVESS